MRRTGHRAGPVRSHDRWRRGAAVALYLLCPLSAWAQFPAGPEFRVNTYTTSSQEWPAVAADTNGNFVVVWESEGQDGSLDGVFARRFTSAGAPRGPEFRVHSATAGSQQAPSVASGPAGQLVVVWESFDGDGDGIFGQRFDAFGTPVGGEFRVNAYTTAGQVTPAVAMDTDGNFVVAWASDGLDGSQSASVFQLFDASGVPQGAAFQVNTYTTNRQNDPAVAFDAAGNFVVVWAGSGDQDGNNYGVFARRFSPAGTPLSGEFQVNAYTTSTQRDPVVAYAPSGNFVIAWSSTGADGDSTGVFGRLFDAAGTPLGGEIQLNAYTTSVQARPSLGMIGDGSFIVTWRSSFQDGDDVGGYGRRFDASGAPVGGEVRVNTYTTGAQQYPVVATNPDGDLAVAWFSAGQDGSFNGIYAQRYGDLIFQDDFESGALALWSAANADGFDLDASGPAALAGTDVGLQAFVDDTSALFVQDDTPNAENRYRVRFYLDPNGFDPGESVNKRRVRVFIAFNGSSQRLVTLVLRRLSGAYSLMARVRRDDGTRADTAFFPITNAPHVVEFDWRRSISPVASNGSLALYIDDVLATTLSGIDNDASPVEFARLGVMTVKTAAASGTVLLDQFESRRLNYIGPE